MAMAARSQKQAQENEEEEEEEDESAKEKRNPRRKGNASSLIRRLRWKAPSLRIYGVHGFTHLVSRNWSPLYSWGTEQQLQRVPTFLITCPEIWFLQFAKNVVDLLG